MSAIDPNDEDPQVAPRGSRPLRRGFILCVMSCDVLDAWMQTQRGCLARRQVLAAGLTDAFIARQLRSRRWATVHPGVYIDHTGTPSWEQRTWAAVLFYWPAALCHESVAYGVTPTIHVAIEHPRKAVRLPGVRLHRLVDLNRRVRWNLSPPQLRIEDAVIDVAAEARERSRAIAVVSDACQQRRTTAERLSVALRERRRVRHRPWLLRLLTDTDDGALSVLEHAYLRRVEQAHGLPRGRRQVIASGSGRRTYRDVEYDGYLVIVELDGRLGHEMRHDRWDDMDRDLASAIDGRQTIRIGWRQVDRTPCRSAIQLSRLLQLRGWSGAPKPCGPNCPVGR